MTGIHLKMSSYKSGVSLYFTLRSQSHPHLRWIICCWVLCCHSDTRHKHDSRSSIKKSA